MLESIKQPEYTGENRCPPCTAVNVVIALVIGAIPVVAGVPGGTGSLVAAGGILAVSIGAIYFRGYLVPGTPTLTKRYMPEPILALFGKAPEPSAAGGAIQADALGESGEGNAGGSGGNGDASSGGAADADTVEDVDPERFLLEIGAVEPCEGDDLCLTDAFRSAWNERIATDSETDVTAETITERLGAPDDDYEITEHYDSWVLKNSARNVAQWPSRAALVADSAAAATLSSWTDRWEALAPGARSELVAGLRLFLEDCPTGEGGVAFDEETVESCCRQQTVVTLSCAETGERLLEVPAPDG